jgi:hypothetical protein
MDKESRILLEKQKKAIKAAEHVANEEIKKLKESLIEWLEERQEAYFTFPEGNVTAMIVESVQKKGEKITEEELAEFKRFEMHVKALMYNKIAEIIEEVRKTVGIKKEVKIP